MKFWTHMSVSTSIAVFCDVEQSGLLDGCQTLGEPRLLPFSEHNIESCVASYHGGTESEVKLKCVYPSIKYFEYALKTLN